MDKASTYETVSLYLISLQIASEMLLNEFYLFFPKGMSGVLGKNPTISGRRLQKGQGLSTCQGTSGTTLRHSLFFLVTSPLIWVSDCHR